MDIIIGGAAHPVTAKFQAEVLGPHPDLASRPFNELENMRDELLKLSNRRYNWQEPKPKGVVMAPGGTLTVAEAGRLDAITHVLNVHKAVAFLQGRSHTEFGFEGVDQVHATRIDKACGCSLHHVFDHHRRHEEANPTYPHYPMASCGKHAPLLGDYKAHHAAALADNPSPVIDKLTEK